MNLVPKNSTEYTRNGFRYSAEESAHSEAFRGLRKSQFRDWERKKNHAPANRIDSMFLSETCFGTEFQEPSIFSMEGIPSIFLLCGTVRNIIFRVSCFAEWFRMEFREFYFYICSMVQNSEHSAPLWNGYERNSESFLFRRTAGIPPEQTNCSVYSIFREIIFLSEIANPSA